MSVTIKHFYPVSTWTPDAEGQKWDSGRPTYLIDETTGDRYWNQPKSNIRIKCFLLAAGGSPIFSVVKVAYRILRLVSFSHFWKTKEAEESYSLKGRLKEAGQDLLGIIITPIALAALEVSAIYGIFSPHNGRKLYASIERCEKLIFALCFQANPQHHLLGGDSDDEWGF